MTVQAGLCRTWSEPKLGSQAQLKSRVTAALRDNTHAMHNNCNERPPPPRVRYILNTYSIHKVSSLKFAAYFQGRLSRHILLPPPRRLIPSLALGTTWVRQPRSGGCHHPNVPLPPNVTNSRVKPQQTPLVEKHAPPPRLVYCAIYSTLTRFTKFRV